jgi:hypothetical protein
MENYGTYAYDGRLASAMAEELNKSYSDKSSMHQYHKVYAHILGEMVIFNFLGLVFFSTTYSTPTSPHGKSYFQHQIFTEPITKQANCSLLEI